MGSRQWNGPRPLMPSLGPGQNLERPLALQFPFGNVPRYQQQCSGQAHVNGYQVQSGFVVAQQQFPQLREKYEVDRGWEMHRNSVELRRMIQGSIHVQGSPMLQFFPMFTTTTTFPFIRPQQPTSHLPLVSRLFQQAGPVCNAPTLFQIQGQWSTIPRHPLFPAPQIPSVLYHYTSLCNLTSILKHKALFAKPQPEGVILPTARFGTGIYFTDLGPHYATEHILKNNYGTGPASLTQTCKTEVCFQFLSNLLPRLVFCEGQSCLWSGISGHARRIWKVDLQILTIGDTDGFYYIRELDGLGLPKSITKKRWNADLTQKL